MREMLNEYGPIVLLVIGISLMIVGVAWQLARWIVGS